MGDFRFPKRFHLLRSSDFRQVYRRGARRRTGSLVVYRLSNDRDHPRLGLSVGRKFGKAVRRNRIRRLVREAVRLNWRRWGLGGSDVVIIPKGDGGRFRLDDVSSELQNVFTHRRRRG